MIRIGMMGTGYVGLVTGACFADFGHHVICTDIDADKIERLKRAELPIYEPGLQELVERNREERRLQFTTDIPEMIRSCQVIFIAVGTPPKRDGSADLSAISEAARLIADCHDGSYKVVVQKSTAPVGTARRVWHEMLERSPDVQIDVASNPEFLREGSAIETFMRPDRVVIGAETPRSQRVMRELYRPLYLIETPMVMTGIETAELIKYAANAFLATKISFINEMANLAEAVGADVQMVAKGIGLDGRIGRKFLHAGPGYGGSCFPKDTKALVRFGRAAGIPIRIVGATIEVNKAQQERMVLKIQNELKTLKNKRIAVLGLSFKPNTDDIRDSPALAVARGLLAKGAKVVAHDPVAMDNVAKTPIGKKLEFALDPYSAADGADALVLVTEWNQYRRLDLKRVAKQLRRPLLFDLRNVYQPEDAIRAGLEYHGVGRPPAPVPPKSRTNGHSKASTPPVKSRATSKTRSRSTTKKKTVRKKAVTSRSTAKRAARKPAASKTKAATRKATRRSTKKTVRNRR